LVDAATSPTGSTIASFTYTYDKTMHRLTKAEPGKNHDYTYDDVYRLAHSVPTPLNPNSNAMRAEDFTHDVVGNRVTGPDSIETYTYGQDNRLTSLALATPLTSAKDYTYTHDFENRLTGVVKVVNGITTTVTFKYDPFGRRIEKRVSATQNGQSLLNSYTYVYDKEDVILEYLTRTINNGAPTHVVKKYVHGPGVDEPLAVAKGNNIYFYHADGVGSVVALTNWSGATVEGYTYDTFGKFQRFGNAVMNTYGFTGREYDAETGLYYYRARYYDPQTGRFISKDPIGFAGGDANLYNYVLGDPVNWADPWGLAQANPWSILSQDDDFLTTVYPDLQSLSPGQLNALKTTGLGGVVIGVGLAFENPKIIASGIPLVAQGGALLFVEFGLGGNTDNYPSNLQLLKLIGKGVYSNFTKEKVCP